MCKRFAPFFSYAVYTFVFILFVLFVFFYTNSQHIVGLGPQSVHSWRQADGASYTLNYYQNKQPFFKPQVHSLLGQHGYTVSEFPFVYYVAAQLYKITGPHPSILRSLHFFIFCFGCICLLWLGLLYFNNKWLGLLPVLVVFVAPYQYYYALNFLPDVPAFSLSLVGLFLLATYFSNKKLWLLYLAMIVFCLGLLLKISSGIALVAVVCTFVFNKEFRSSKYFNTGHLWHFAALVAGVILVNVAWLFFVHRYNNQYGNHANLFGVLPVWQLPVYKIGGIALAFLTHWVFAFLSPVYWLVLLGGIILIYRQRHVFNSIAFAIGVWCIVGSLIYSLLWYQALREHDYYLVPQFIGVVAIAFALTYLADTGYQQYKNSIIGIAVILLLSGVGYLKYEMNRRYTAVQYQYFSKAFFTIEPYLRSIGISRTDNVLSIPDNSPNSTLYYLNQPGYTNPWLFFFDTKNALAEKDIKYIVVGGDFSLPESLAAETDSLVGRYEDISIYRVKRQ